MSLLSDNAPFLLVLGIVSVAAVAVGLLAERMAHRASAAARHSIILAALLLPLLLIVASAVGLNLPLPSAAPGGAVDAAITQAAAAGEAPARSVWPGVVVAMWLIGAAIALLRVAATARRWRDVARHAVPIFDDELLRQFGARHELAQSPDCPEPTVIGILKPVVVLPAGYELSPAELKAVFAHELAHVARHDNLVALLVQVVCALFWLDPLHRIARHRLIELRERACDDAVLDAGCDPGAYLAALARSCQRSFNSPAVACMSRLNLQERMESIMTHQTRSRVPAWIVRTFVSAAVAAAALVFATFAPSPSLNAGEPPFAAETGYDFDVRVVPYENRFSVAVRVDTPEGPFSSVAVVNAVPDTRTITSTHGGKTYKVTVNLAVDGSAVASFEVSDATRVLSAATKTFVKPEPRALPAAKRIEPGITPPKVISRVEAVYPMEAKVKGIAGVCIVEATIDEKGNVAEVRVVKPLPHGLSEATVDAVKQWKFEPGMKDGKPVPVIFNITMNYKPE